MYLNDPTNVLMSGDHIWYFYCYCYWFRLTSNFVAPASAIFLKQRKSFLEKDYPSEFLTPMNGYLLMVYNLGIQLECIYY